MELEKCRESRTLSNEPSVSDCNWQQNCCFSVCCLSRMWKVSQEINSNIQNAFQKNYIDGAGPMGLTGFDKWDCIFF